MSGQPTRDRPAMPSAIAPAAPAALTAISTGPGIRVRSGRPRSSSRAWAAIPTARKKASRVASRRLRPTWGASAAPMTT